MTKTKIMSTYPTKQSTFHNDPNNTEPANILGLEYYLVKEDGLVLNWNNTDYVWVVSNDDCEIIGIYTDQEKADSILARCNGNIKKMRVNRYANNYLSWFIQIIESGKIEKIQIYNHLPVDSYFIADEYFYDPNGQLYDERMRVNIRCFAKNEEHAKRIANRVLAKVIKENLWKKGYIDLEDDYE